MITEGSEFAGFDEGSEICLYTEATLAYACGPTPAEMDAPGALIHLGYVSVPQGGGGGGGPGPTDSDGDGVPDSSDNCPNTPNANQANNDGDAQGDACDPDDDNDGILDVDEVGVYGTNPFLWDTDGDGFSDWEEIYVHGTDPLDDQSFPQPEVPALGAPGLFALTALLMAMVWVLPAARRRLQ